MKTPPRPTIATGPKTGSRATPSAISTAPLICLATSTPSIRAPGARAGGAVPAAWRSRARTASASAEVEQHAADLALVQDVGREDLQHHRVAEGLAPRRRPHRRSAQAVSGTAGDAGARPGCACPPPRSAWSPAASRARHHDLAAAPRRRRRRRSGPWPRSRRPRASGPRSTRKPSASYSRTLLGRGDGRTAPRAGRDGARAPRFSSGRSFGAERGAPPAVW